MIQIPLTKGYVAIVDDEDADLAGYKWHASICNTSVYARRDYKVDGKLHYDLMHRVIGERIANKVLARADQIDHKDGIGTNNLRSNLRVCSHIQNMMNRKKSKLPKSGFRGVKRSRSKSVTWEAYIGVNRRRIYLGTFITPEEAHETYKQALIKYFGEFARL